jgi:hypothetical protein
VAAEILDIETTLGELKSLLEQTASEDELLREVTDRVAKLRTLYPSNRDLFTPSRIEFLKYAASMSNQLLTFAQIKDELAHVSTLDEYEAAVSCLTEIKGKLAPLAVAKRVTNELRALSEKAPAIRAQHAANRRFRVETKICDLERDAPDCQRGHTMVIRAGPQEHLFWGCSQYPMCSETAHLTKEQKAVLSAG